jgi:regulator of protease activity HflC (stomatin/prohibitin superfamily)
VEELNGFPEPEDHSKLELIDGVLYMKVIDPERASYGISNYNFAISQLAQTSLRSVIGKLELDKTFEERDIINAQVVQAIDEAALNWGVKVLRYEIKDLTPPKEILHAMQQQITAEREKRALIAASEGRRQEQINIATGEREAYIARSEGEKQAAILRAEGEREAAFRDAEGRERAAEAEANATRFVSEAIANGSIQAVNYFVAQKYVEALKAIASAPNQKVLFMPLEAAGVIGAIGGVADIARAAFTETPPRTADRRTGSVPGTVRTEG